MYAFIFGTVEETDKNGIVLSAGDIGYYLQCPASVMNAVSAGEKRKIYTYLHVREDAIVLFGFLTKEDKAMFLRLISVSGIGPKIALQVLSSISAGDLALILVGGDASALTRVPGIGKKTAQRLILELREKVENDELKDAIADKGNVPAAAASAANDAVYALTALGYSPQDAEKAVESVIPECKNTEEIIRTVLRSFDRR